MNAKWNYFVSGVDCTIAILNAVLGHILMALFMAGLGAYMMWLGNNKNENL